MIERKTVIDRIEVRRDGSIALHLAKLLVEDSNEIASEPHLRVIEPDRDIESEIAIVNDHLQANGEATVDANGLDELSRIADIVRTPDRVDQFKMAQAVSAERLKAAI